LNDLRKNGYKMAIASASRNAARILQITGLERLVDEVCDGRFTGPTKPAPDQFIEAARLLGREPEECVVFEDANVGVDGAWAAGSYIIGIGPAVKDRVELDYCLDTLSSVGFQRLHEIVSAFPQRETAVAA
jgi:beta-phosphoglucomutase-like phosphatase (HAD superfamily)